MKRKAWKRARRVFVDEFGLDVSAPFVDVAAEVMKRYPRIQYDGKGAPETVEEAGAFLSFAVYARQRRIAHG